MNNQIIIRNEAFLLEESKSFSIPIMRLKPPLKSPVLCQYNLNKLLDIIEDANDLSIQDKCDYMDALVFGLSQRQTDEVLLKTLLELPSDETKKFYHYPWVIKLFNGLDEHEKALCLHYCGIMKTGMKKYLGTTIVDMADMDDYCYYSAGVVGEFLTGLLFYAYQLSERDFKELPALSRHVGLLLQKTNNLRDYYEDTYILKKVAGPKASPIAIHRFNR